MDVEVFIGDLNDPEFNMEKGDWNGNIPSRINDFFPYSNDAFSKIVDKVINHELSGKQTDWSSWTAALYPHQTSEVISYIYGLEVCRKDREIKNILSFIQTLDSNQQYGLVACEMI